MAKMVNAKLNIPDDQCPMANAMLQISDGKVSIGYFSQRTGSITHKQLLLRESSSSSRCRAIGEKKPALFEKSSTIYLLQNL
jgi:hypothetical protein